MSKPEVVILAGIQRKGKQEILEKVLIVCNKNLEPPTFEEGFDDIDNVVILCTG